MPAGAFFEKKSSCWHDFFIESNSVMIRKFTLSLLALAAVSAYAEDRSDAQMKSIAADKLQSMGLLANFAKGKAADAITEAMDLQQMKIYTAEGSGFVIVSKDNRIQPVLAYSSSSLDVQNMPCCMQWWMDATDKSLANAIKRGDDLPDGSDRPTFRPVEPFLKCHWGQGAPYNDLAPLLGKKNAPSGCVATAMAQVIWYNRFPASAEFMGSYTEPGNNVVKKENVSSTYNYDHMVEGYGSYTAFGEKKSYDYPEVEGRAVAQLMHDCALASKMDFASGGSGAAASDYGDALHTCFGYPKQSVKLYQRFLYTADEWHKLVYDELMRQCPLMYGGSRSSGGHCFVVHGIDENGLVYVNWGWDGNSDGYFDMDLMNSEGDNDGYSAQQDIVAGIRSNPLPGDVVTSIFGSLDFKASKLLRSVSISGMAYNFGAYTFEGKVGYRIIDEMDGSVQYVDIPVEKLIYPWYGIDMSLSINPTTSKDVTIQASHSYIILPVTQCTEEIHEGRFSLVRERIDEKKYGNLVWFRIIADESRKCDIEKHFGEIPNVTGINQIIADAPSAPAGTFNLMGQKVPADYRGVVITNGKKFIKR